MNSYQSFDVQVQNFARGLVNAVTAIAPLALILIILGIAGANCYLEYLFQVSIFADFALIPAMLVGGFRFASGMGGISLLKTGRYIVGIFFGLVSLALTYYTASHIPLIAQSIAPAAAIQAELTFKIIIWGGMIGEIMIAAFMATTADNSPTPAADLSTADLTDEQEKAWIPETEAKPEKTGWLDMLTKAPTLGNGISPNGNGQKK